MWRLFCHYLYLISPSFSGSGSFGFMTVAFSGIFAFLCNSISLIEIRCLGIH